MEYKKTKVILKLKILLKDLIYLIIGCTAMGVGTSSFLLPNQLSTGGFSGLATIIYYFFNIPIGTAMMILNIPLFCFAFIKLKKMTTLKALIGTITLTITLNFFNKYNLTSDNFLACVYGGILIGIGLAFVLKGNASTGGSDLLTQIIKKYRPHFKSSSLIVIIDTIIVSLNVMFFKTLEIGLYSAIAIYIMGKMIDLIFEGINFTKMIFVISRKYKEIAMEIGTNLERGSTGIYAKGMYTRDKKMMLLCVVSRNEVAKVKEIALSIDKKAFIVIVNARETWGKGFKE